MYSNTVWLIYIQLYSVPNLFAQQENFDCKYTFFSTPIFPVNLFLLTFTLIRSHVSFKSTML